MLQKKVAEALDLPVGMYLHHANSFHAYEKDWQLLEAYANAVARGRYLRDGGLKASAYYKLLSEMQSNIISLDKQIQAKQNMMLGIEKECAMTISSAMRSIPKTTGKAENPLLAALRDEDEE